MHFNRKVLGERCAKSRSSGRRAPGVARLDRATALSYGLRLITPMCWRERDATAAASGSSGSSDRRASVRPAAGPPADRIASGLLSALHRPRAMEARQAGLDAMVRWLSAGDDV